MPTNMQVPGHVTVPVAPDDTSTPLLQAHQPGLADNLQAAAGAAVDRLVRVERTALPSLHWLQGTLGSGMMAGALMYGALGGGTPAEEGLARAGVVLGSHWYVGGVRELLAVALQAGVGGPGSQVPAAAAAAAAGAWLGLMGGTALLGSAFRPAQYTGLALYHTAVMAASACLRYSYQLESRRAEAAVGGPTSRRNTAWAMGCAAVVAGCSIAAGGTFWLTSRGSSLGALAAGGAGFHVILLACRAMGLMQARAFPRGHRADGGACL